MSRPMLLRTATVPSKRTCNGMIGSSSPEFYLDRAWKPRNEGMPSLLSVSVSLLRLELVHWT